MTKQPKNPKPTTNNTTEKFGMSIDQLKGPMMAPQEAYRFKLVPIFIDAPTTDFTNNAESCVVDHIAKTLTIKVRFSRDPYYMIFAKNMLKQKPAFTIEFLNGGSQETINYSTHFTQCEITTSTFTVDYSSGAILYHNLVVKYKDFVVQLPDTK